MKNFANLLFGYLLLINLSFSLAVLDFGSFHPKKTFAVSGNAATDFFGFEVSSAGDVDNDGYDDILVGASSKSGSRGAVYVIYGGDISALLDINLATQTLNPSTTGFMLTGSAAGDCFGFSASTAGDINKDGYDDIIVGAYANSANKGAAYLIYGGDKSAMSNWDFSTGATLTPSTTGFMMTGNFDDRLGSSVSSAGDINNDGYDDIIIGAVGKNSYRGAAHVIYGGEKSAMSNWDFDTETLNPTSTGFTITGNAAGDYFGASVSSAGDINNDGCDDIIIGAKGKNNDQGAAYVIYGGAKSTMSTISLASTPLNPALTGFMITGNSADNYFGTSVSTAGDINNDEYSDIIIGASKKNSNQGAAYVIYGGAKSAMSNIVLSLTTLNPTSNGFTITGNAAGDMLGYSVSSAGDVNNDEYDDIIVGAYGKDSYQGAAYVIYGGDKSAMSNWDFSTGATLDPLTTGLMITGEVVGDRFGSSVTRAGDFNKDGFDDFIIGAHMGNSNTGAAYLILGPFKCPDNCNNCDSPSSCLDCSQGYVLDQSLCSPCPSNCISCSSTSTCNACSLGYALVNSASCSQCTTNCYSCSSPSSCEICNTPYLLYHEQCAYEICPSTTFQPDPLKCEDCSVGCSVCSSKSICEKCLDGFTLTKQKRCQVIVTEIKIEEKDSEKAAAGVFEGTSLVGASLSSGSSLPLNFGLVAKIMRNFKYMALPVSRELQETFVSWKVASGFMSAPDSWREEYSSKTIPTVFSRYGLQSAFLINFWKPFSMALVGIAVFAIFKVIEISSMRKDDEKKSTLSTISRHVNVAASNFALTQLYSNLDDVIFYFILEMRSTEFETGFRACSSLFAIIFLVVGGIIIGVHWKLVGKYQSLKGKENSTQLKGFETKYENIKLIFKDFKDTNVLVQSFLMINVVRSIVSSLIFATLFEYPMIQISFLFVLNILMLVYLWNKKSFKDLANTGGQIFCEVILFIANICVFLLALFDHADSYPITPIENIGKCIIVLNYILLFGCALLLLVNLGKILYQAYLERKNGAKVFQAPMPNDSGIFAQEKLKTTGSALAQSENSISTNGGFLNESQNNLHSDSFQNNHPSYYNPASPERHSSNFRPQQKISSNYSIPRNQNSIETFEMPSSSNALQSNQIVEDYGEETTHTVLPRSRLLRNREITKARIAQFSSSPERRIQDPSSF